MVSATSNIAVTVRNLGQLKETAKMIREMLEGLVCILEEEHPYIISAMESRGSLMRKLGEMEEAARLRRKVVECKDKNSIMLSYRSNLRWTDPVQTKSSFKFNGNISLIPFQKPEIAPLAAHFSGLYEANGTLSPVFSSQ